MSARSREQLDHLMPQLLDAARTARAGGVPVASVPADAGGGAALVVSGVAGRTARRAQTPGTAVWDSAFLAERVIAQPLLLDDVLDPRIDQLPFKRADISAEIARVLTTLDEREAEAELERINEFKSSTAFRLGLAFNDGRADAVATARRLARWPNRW
jgi:glutamate-ammonia-ligase adenylyltransferase